MVMLAMITMMIVMTMIRKNEDEDKNYDEEEDREEIPPIAGSIVARASRTHTVWKSHLETVAIEKIDSFWHFQCLKV